MSARARHDVDLGELQRRAAVAGVDISRDVRAIERRVAAIAVKVTGRVDEPPSPHVCATETGSWRS